MLTHWITRMSTVNPKRYCVYTCLYGGYETLTVQPVRNNSSIDWICFTDDPTLAERFPTSGWDIRVMPPAITDDMARSSRHPKLCPHLYLGEYDGSLYIDNSITLLERPETLLERYLTPAVIEGIDFVCLAHSHRESVLDEFLRVEEVRYDYPEILHRQREQYLNEGYDLTIRPIWGGLLMRNHSPIIAAHGDAWWSEVVRHSKRDQLSFTICAQKLALRYRALPLSNKLTTFHRWRGATVVRHGSPVVPNSNAS